MATKKQRGLLEDRLMQEFAAFADALTAAGYEWADVWATSSEESFPEESRLWWLYGRFVLARECAAMADHRLTDEQIAEFYRARLCYRELFPDGPGYLGPPPRE
jgi:uncharacterized NAD(P)/FAD-binding protein YdhS